MRKKSIIIILFTIISFTAIFVINNTGKHYSRETYVQFNNGEKIIFNDTWDNNWSWIISNKEESLLSIGEKVTLTFDTNKTYDFVDDDILIKIEKKY